MELKPLRETGATVCAWTSLGGPLLINSYGHTCVCDVNWTSKRSTIAMLCAVHRVTNQSASHCVNLTTRGRSGENCNGLFESTVHCGISLWTGVIVCNDLAHFHFATLHQSSHSK